MSEWQDVAHWPDLMTDRRVAKAAYGDPVADPIERDRLEMLVDELVQNSLSRLEEGVVAELDYTEESLAWLDGMIDSGFAETDKPVDGVLEALVMDWGSYLGQMLIDSLGGEWYFREPLWHSSIHFASAGVECFPYHRVAKRFLQGPSESLGLYYQALVDLLTAGQT